ncbi:YicC/YloC family endoribonuclease [Helcococcus sueciensis]|uniref:YicC/YloC family endoribonuclease n=1 Tax=Helcococcus sueciensis TaxID=241555 RepID=UPI00041BE499|nr:YicC/YloC family endoribonuclease [Helcococcus sueciensis]
MIKSMTGYGKSSYMDDKLNIEVEIKSVNSRFLDINTRMPYQLNFMEDKINKLIRKYIKRGRIDLFIKSKTKSLGNTNITIDEVQAGKMYEALNSLKNTFNLEGEYRDIRISDILRNEDVLRFEAEELDDEYLSLVILNTIEEVLVQLVNMRIAEGLNLKNDLSNNIDILKENRENICNQVKNLKEEIRNKLFANIQEILDQNIINEDRLANEIVFYADRQDINEELSRLNSHFIQFEESLETNEAIGKKLDFISQEMLREVNTIGSKTSNINVTNHVIEMKTTIEKIKEQVQNIE